MSQHNKTQTEKKKKTLPVPFSKSPQPCLACLSRPAFPISFSCLL